MGIITEPFCIVQTENVCRFSNKLCISYQKGGKFIYLLPVIAVLSNLRLIPALLSTFFAFVLITSPLFVAQSAQSQPQQGGDLLGGIMNDFNRKIYPSGQPPAPAPPPQQGIPGGQQQPQQGGDLLGGIMNDFNRKIYPSGQPPAPAPPPQQGIPGGQQQPQQGGDLLGGIMNDFNRKIYPSGQPPAPAPPPQQGIPGGQQQPQQGGDLLGGIMNDFNRKIYPSGQPPATADIPSSQASSTGNGGLLGNYGNPGYALCLGGVYAPCGALVAAGVYATGGTMSTGSQYVYGGDVLPVAELCVKMHFPKNNDLNTYSLKQDVWLDLASHL